MNCLVVSSSTFAVPETFAVMTQYLNARSAGEYVKFDFSYLTQVRHQ